MVLFNKLMVSILAVSSFAAAQTKTDKTDDVAQRALKLHHSIFTLDTHCDTPMSLGRYDVGVRHERGQGKQDLPRMKEGGLSASCFAVYLGQGPRTADGYVKAKERALATFGQLEAMFKKYPELCEQAYTPADFKRITNTGKRAILVSMENGYSIGIDVNNVNEYYAKGARMMGLVHSSNNDICDSATDRAVSGGTDKGLSEFGKSVVKRMNELGVVIDVSHASDKSFFDTLAISNSPIMASHSSARAICGHARNLSDEMLRALKKNGGVIQLCILSDYIKARKIDPEQKKLQDDLNARIAEFGGYEALREKPGGEALMAEARALRAKFGGLVATVKDAVDHIDHIVKLIGIDHVGIGTDFDGGGALVDCFDVTELPNITIELVRRGYSEKDIRKIWGENALRVFEQAQKNRAAGAAKPAPQGEGSDVAQNFTFNDMEVTYKPPAPPYPKMAMAAKIGGPVTLEMVIGADGVPTSATAISGHELLRGTATEWAKNWRFKPAVVDGRTVPARFTMGLNFMLPK